MFKIKYWYIFIILIPLILTNCAKRGTITGGAKDTLAPVLTSSNPKNFSTNFTGNKIVLNFDENIKMKDANKQIIISPPLKERLSISPLGGISKEITIQFKDTLKENTTYSINFGQSIQDNNEGNPYSNFKYVFSTGTQLDSLKLKGNLKDAISNIIPSFVSVMLYPAETFTDSTVYKTLPTYITNTLEGGSAYELDFIKEGEYFVVALKDENNNNLYDPTTDKIAFHPEKISIPNDTILNLNIFKAETLFEVKRPAQISQNKLSFGIRTVSYDDLKVETFLNNSKIDTRFTRVTDKDSIQLWMPNSAIKDDSLKVKVFNNGNERSHKIKLKEMKAIDSLALIISPNSAIDFSDNYKIKVNTPIENFDLSKVSLIKKDSTQHDFEYELDKFENHIIFKFDKEEEQLYTLQMLPGAITDYYGKKNDSISTKISTKAYSDYGNLNLSITNAKSYPLILQLLDEKEVIVYEKYSEGINEFVFDNILPKKYLIRIIYDTDKNKKWTTGDYILKKQPEEVYYFQGLIDVRANWDVIQPPINLQE